MKTRLVFAGVLLVLLFVAVGCPSMVPMVMQELKAGVSGAIFTTLADGSAVNHNIYTAKEDVYLDGGPGNDAPQDAAGLPPGLYYFQVTDPPGKTLLSTDDISCRTFFVDEGIIKDVYPPDKRRVVDDGDCKHLTGIDQDHGDKGAITVQLYPFNNTPNKGGVYKVWVTLVENYNPDDANSKFGFVPRFSKTDNFKIKGRPCVTMRVLKFNDLDWDGDLDCGEPQIGVDEFVEAGGWPITATDPLGVINNGFAPWSFFAEPPGQWVIFEEAVGDWHFTGSFRDNVDLGETNPVPVNVVGTSGEFHEVIFMNADPGSICAFKFYDADGDGPCDEDQPVESFPIYCVGTDCLGNSYGPDCKMTDCDGRVCWDDLVPGTYTVYEELCGNWRASSDTCVNICIEAGDYEEATFSNYCEGEALMHTKGFWQNPNGCEIVGANPEYLDELNCLAPYLSGYIDAHGQDNCAGVHCGDVFLPFNSNSELGCYLVAPNSQDGRLGLAQQLAAFILNMLDQCGSMDVYLTDLGMSSEDIIDGAICAWQTGQDVNEWQCFIDELNNAGYLSFINSGPCSLECDGDGGIG